MSQLNQPKRPVPELLPKPDIIAFERRIILEFAERYGADALVNLLQELCLLKLKKQPQRRSQKD